MINWVCKPFSELSVYELYTMLRLRNEVFVAEQNCVYQDADNKDQNCFHLCGRMNETLIAYARLVPPGISFNEVSIGRILTSPASRGNGSGKMLMQQAIAFCRQIFGNQNIRIGAQFYLKRFYESFGFVQCSGKYVEDNIIHIEMILCTFNN